MQCERMRAMPEQLRILLSGTNHHITEYQGNTMDAGLRRYDECFGRISQLYVYRATMGGSNFKDPIPAFLPTHGIYQFRGARRRNDKNGLLVFILRTLFRFMLFIIFKPSPRRRPGAIAPQGLIIPLPRPSGHPFASEGDFHTATVKNKRAGGALHCTLHSENPTPRTLPRAPLSPEGNLARFLLLSSWDLTPGSR